MSDETREAGADPQTNAKPHPRRLHPSDMYGICRKSRGETGQQAWIVRLSRGGKFFQSTFADSSFGGRAQALHVARAWRDAVLEVVPPLTRAEMRQVQRRKAPGDHVSEITGVTYAKETPGRAAAWIARIELPAEAIPGRPTKGDRRPRRSNVRAAIEAVFDEELASFLGRLRYDWGRRPGERLSPLPPRTATHRHLRDGNGEGAAGPDRG